MGGEILHLVRWLFRQRDARGRINDYGCQSLSRSSSETEFKESHGRRLALNLVRRAGRLALIAVIFCASPFTFAELGVDTLPVKADIPNSLVAKLKELLNSDPLFAGRAESWEGLAQGLTQINIEEVQGTQAGGKSVALENDYISLAGTDGVSSNYKPTNALNLFDPITRPANYAQEIVDLEDFVSRSVAIIARATQLIVEDAVYNLELGYVADEYTQPIGTTVQGSIACEVSGGYNVSVTRTDFRTLEGTISAQQCNSGSLIANGTASFTYDEDLWNWSSDILPSARALVFTVDNLQLQDNVGRSYVVTGQIGCAPHTHVAIERSSWVYLFVDGKPVFPIYTESVVFRNTYLEESGWLEINDGYRVQSGQQTTQVFGDYGSRFCDLKNVNVSHQGQSISVPELNLGLYYDGYTAHGRTLANVASYAGTNANQYELFGSLPPLNNNEGDFFFSAGQSEPMFHASSLSGELISLDALWERLELPEFTGVPGIRVAHLQSNRNIVSLNQFNPNTGKAEYASDYDRSYSVDTDDDGVQETIVGWARSDLSVGGCQAYQSLRTPSEIWHIGYEELDGSDSSCHYRDIFTQSAGLIQKDPDTDGDGRSNAFDPDDDGDGANDTVDAFAKDPAETTDTDGDGVGNNADDDDDNDGTPDSSDAFPLDSSETLDTDGDGIGNNADTDDDGDSVADTQDAFPLDASESEDSDADGIGNNADLDDDNDGASDEDEINIGTDPFDPDSDDDGLFDGAEVAFGSDPLEADTDGDSIGDGQEIELGLDPRNPNDCPEEYCPSSSSVLKIVPILIEQGRIGANDS